MSASDRAVVYDGGQLFRVVEEPVDGRARPYEFVQRVGAVTILPIVTDEQGRPYVLAIRNQRLYYGTSDDLPGGNRDGGFEDPESPAVTALRELKEETGYGYTEGQEQQITVLALRRISKTIEYPRHIVVVRNVSYVGGEDNNPHEVVTPTPTPIEEFLEPFFNLEAGGFYPEMNAAFAHAAMTVGRDAVIEWLVDGTGPESEQVLKSFRPWLLAE